MYVQKSDRLPMKVPGCASNMKPEGGKGALGNKMELSLSRCLGFAANETASLYLLVHVF